METKLNIELLVGLWYFAEDPKNSAYKGDVGEIIGVVDDANLLVTVSATGNRMKHQRIVGLEEVKQWVIFKDEAEVWGYVNFEQRMPRKRPH